MVRVDGEGDMVSCWDMVDDGVGMVWVVGVEVDGCFDGHG